jgi:hypothetical protein
MWSTLEQRYDRRHSNCGCANHSPLYPRWGLIVFLFGLLWSSPGGHNATFGDEVAPFHGVSNVAPCACDACPCQGRGGLSVFVGVPVEGAPLLPLVTADFFGAGRTRDVRVDGIQNLTCSIELGLDCTGKPDQRVIAGESGRTLPEARRTGLFCIAGGTGELRGMATHALDCTTVEGVTKDRGDGPSLARALVQRPTN